LSNWYETQRLIKDKALREKLGAAGAEAERALAPRNGFRFGAGGGRQFDAEPGIAASNVIVEGAAPVSLGELLRTVRDGLYVGRIWYTYPINGLRAGDFTCTVVADSYIIRDGRLAAPLKANAIRINENIGKILNSIVGITKDVRGTILRPAALRRQAHRLARPGPCRPLQGPHRPRALRGHGAGGLLPRVAARHAPQARLAAPGSSRPERVARDRGSDGLARPGPVDLARTGARPQARRLPRARLLHPRRRRDPGRPGVGGGDGGAEARPARPS